MCDMAKRSSPGRLGGTLYLKKKLFSRQLDGKGKDEQTKRLKVAGKHGPTPWPALEPSSPSVEYQVIRDGLPISNSVKTT